MLCIFATVMTFSCFIPLILPLGFVHFGFKYLVDKYNLCYVCPKDYESEGKILHTALSYVVTCIVTFQVAMSAFFALV
jgi:hypothetical protein